MEINYLGITMERRDGMPVEVLGQIVFVILTIWGLSFLISWIVNQVNISNKQQVTLLDQILQLDQPYNTKTDMKKYLLLALASIVILSSCSNTQPGYNYKKHSSRQQKMYKQTKRVNRGKNQLQHQCTPKRHRQRHEDEQGEVSRTGVQ